MPKQAKIISILKINSSFNTQNKETMEYTFKLSSPLIVSKEDRDIDDVYVFIFSSPCEKYDLDSQKEHSTDVSSDSSVCFKDTDEVAHDNKFNEDEIVYEREGDSVSDNRTFELSIKSSNKKTMLDVAHVDKDISSQTDILCRRNIELNCNLSPVEEFQSQPNALNFSNSETLVLTKKNQDIFQMTEVTASTFDDCCNVCWLFKKTMCDKGFNNKKSNIRSDASPINSSEKDSNMRIKKECQYCWIFKNCEKCHYCTKENNDSAFDTKVDAEKDLICEKKSGVLKRKISCDDELNSKKIKWQCQICLTVNINSEVCVCCDAQGFLKEGPFKMKFHYSKDYFTKPNDINGDTIDSPHTFKLNTIEEIQPDTLEETDKEKRKIDEPILIMDEDHKATDILQPVFEFVASIRDNTHQDAEINTDRYIHEEMDVEEEVPKTAESNSFTNLNVYSLEAVATSNNNMMLYESTSFTNRDVSSLKTEELSNYNKMECGVPMLSFQFQIGSSISGDRRFTRRTKKPLRSSTSFVK